MFFFFFVLRKFEEEEGKISKLKINGYIKKLRRKMMRNDLRTM
jgi:hypothetical protein